MKRLVVLFPVVVCLLVATVLHAVAQDELVVITNKTIKDYQTVIEFDLRELPVRALLQFEAFVKNRDVCPLTYTPGRATLNGQFLTELRNGAALRFHQRTDALKLAGNSLTYQPGSCQRGDDKLGAVRGLVVSSAP